MKSIIQKLALAALLLSLPAGCSKQLKLRLKYPDDRTQLDFTIVLTVQTMNYLHSGRHRVAL